MSVVQKTAGTLLNEVVKNYKLGQKLTVKYPRHKLVKKPSFEEAAKLDASGKWKEAANHYYSFFAKTEDSKEKAKAFILLGQAYINLVQYPLAEKFFREKSRVVGKKLKGWDKTFFEASVLEKIGWIYDYYGRPRKALAKFTTAKKLLAIRARQDTQVLRVYETSNHFIGRQLTILASQNKNPQKNLRLAKQTFEESITIYDRLEKIGIKEPSSKGFQYGWLARIHMLKGKLDRTEEDLQKMKRLFSKALETSPNSGLMGYYYLLEGRLNLERKKIEEARAAFREAYRINTNVVDYKASQADALFGRAMCDYLKGNRNNGLRSAAKAVKLNPNLLRRGFI